MPDQTTPIPIDPNRPQQVRRKSAADPAIHMYFDEPGVYYKANGAPATEAEAKAADFPIEENRRERVRGERMREAEARIRAEMDAQLEQEQKRIAEEPISDAEAAPEPEGPYVKKNAAGEPRETHLRQMEYVSGDGWTVVDKQTMTAVARGLDKARAIEVLLEG